MDSLRVSPNERLADNTALYDYERAKKLFTLVDRDTITLPDAILLLLYAHANKPINGRVSLMKQFFLLTHEVLEGKVHDPKFVPGRFGMYSYHVTNTVSNLEFADYIVRRGRKNTKAEAFQISPKGVKYISPLFQRMPDSLQLLIRQKRKGWDQLGYDGILRYVYRKYPKYLDRSVLKKRYSQIVWGRGIG